MGGDPSLLSSLSASQLWMQCNSCPMLLLLSLLYLDGLCLQTVSQNNLPCKVALAVRALGKEADAKLPWEILSHELCEENSPLIVVLLKAIIKRH